MPNLLTILRYTWASPTTAVGLAVTAATLLTGGRCTRHSGVLEAHGGAARWLLVHVAHASAITFGHVVLALDAPTLARTRRHERIHVRQAERWGPAFIPAYLLASLWAAARGKHYYYDNIFEVEAFGCTEL